MGSVIKTRHNPIGALVNAHGVAKARRIGTYGTANDWQKAVECR